MDVRCMKCGEPWDYYGLVHGDVLAWEADAIRAGIGCPACEGDGPGVEPRLSDLTFGDEDGIDRLDPPDAPYRAPADTLIKSCADCRCRLYQEHASEVYDGAKRSPVYVASFSRNRLADDPDEWHVIDGDDVCPSCVSYCDECGEACRDATAWPSPSDPYRGTICSEECYSTAEHEASEEAWSQWGASEFIRGLVSDFELSEATATFLEEADIWAMLAWRNEHDNDYFSCVDGGGAAYPFTGRAWPTRNHVAALIRTLRKGGE